MYIIGENIHIISPRVKEALEGRNGAFFTELARHQIEAGAQALDLNIGPRKKDGPAVMEWLLDQVSAGAPDAVYSFDTSNLAAIEAGLKKAPRGRAIINSTSAAPERLEVVPPLAAAYGAKLVALTMGSGMIPVKADERVSIALEQLIPRAGGRHGHSRPDHRPARADRLRLPGVLPGVHRGRAHPEICRGPAAPGQRGSLECVQRRAARDASPAQSRLHGDAHGRRRGHGDRRSRWTTSSRKPSASWRSATPRPPWASSISLSTIARSRRANWSQAMWRWMIRSRRLFSRRCRCC